MEVEKEKIAEDQPEIQTVFAGPKLKLKDSVFTHLFKDPKYLLALYQTLHPEDQESRETDLKDITLEPVLTDTLYNDLGFRVNNELIILVEAQSTWSDNICIRLLVYYVETVRRYLEQSEISLHTPKAIPFPEPEFYVVYTGKYPKKPPEEVSLTDTFFHGIPKGADIRAKVIHSPGDDIVGQYIAFCKISDDQRRKYGSSLKAIEETIRICTEKNILVEYLTEHRLEVENVMQELFSTERYLAEVTAREKEARIREKEARIREKKARAKEKKARKKNMAAIMNLYLHNGLSVSAIAQAFGMDPDEVEKIIANHS